LLAGLPHAVGESLVKPCALEMVQLVCWLGHRKTLEAVPVSNDVIRPRKIYFSFNILKIVIQEMAASPFPFNMQLDEATNIS
jgi:hypothetical protein